MGDREQGRKRVVTSPEKARQEAPPPEDRSKNGRTPATLILLYGGCLALMAAAAWAFLFLAGF